jgi:hypothetical protein
VRPVLRSYQSALAHFFKAPYPRLIRNTPICPLGRWLTWPGGPFLWPKSLVTLTPSPSPTKLGEENPQRLLCIPLMNPFYGSLICPIGTMTYGFLGSANKIRGKFSMDGKFRFRWIHGRSIETDPNFTEQSPRTRRNCHRGEQGEDFRGDTARQLDSL